MITEFFEFERSQFQSFKTNFFLDIVDWFMHIWECIRYLQILGENRVISVLACRKFLIAIILYCSISENYCSIETIINWAPVCKKRWDTSFYSGISYSLLFNIQWLFWLWHFSFHKSSCTYAAIQWLSSTILGREEAPSVTDENLIWTHSE